jgi:hypothetical protein
VLKNHIRCDHAFHHCDLCQALADLTAVTPFKNDNDLATLGGANLRVRQGCKYRRNTIPFGGHDGHDSARDGGKVTRVPVGGPELPCEKVASAYGLMHDVSVWRARWTRRPKDHLKNPNRESISAHNPYRHKWPDTESQYQEGNELCAPPWKTRSVGDVAD